MERIGLRPCSCLMATQASTPVFWLASPIGRRQCCGSGLRPVLATPMPEARAGSRVGRPPCSGASCQLATPACGPHGVFSLAHHSTSFPRGYSSLLEGISEHLWLVTVHWSSGKVAEASLSSSLGDSDRFVWGLGPEHGYF